MSARPFMRLAAAFGGVAALFLGWSGLAAAGEPLPPSVRVEATDNIGAVYADPQGKTLYTWAEDHNGVSKCNNERFHKIIGAADIVYYVPSYQTRLTCQEIWAPFAASADDHAVGAWSVITRDDKSRQWAYNNRPLYTFIGDSGPGEINATGPGRSSFGRRPLKAPPALPPGLAVKTTVQGRILLTSTGHTIYAARSGAALKVDCRDDCLASWTPLQAPAVVPDGGRGEWSVVDRDGVRQWAFEGKALYTYSGDQHPGDMNGADKPGWTLVTLQPAPRPPAEFKLEMSSMGDVLADPAGKTIYLFGCVDEAPDRSVCDIPKSSSASYWTSICGSAKTCAATWRPVLAPPGAKPIGHTWSIIPIDATGAQQYPAAGQANVVMAWAYKGRPVYTYAGDNAPGDTFGHRVSASYNWGFSVVGDGTDSINQDFDQN